MGFGLVYNTDPIPGAPSIDWMRLSVSLSDATPLPVLVVVDVEGRAPHLLLAYH